MSFYAILALKSRSLYKISPIFEIGFLGFSTLLNLDSTHLLVLVSLVDAVSCLIHLPTVSAIHTEEKS